MKVISKIKSCQLLVLHCFIQTTDC